MVNCWWIILKRLLNELLTLYEKYSTPFYADSPLFYANSPLFCADSPLF